MLAEEVFVTVFRDTKRRGFPQEGAVPDEDFTDSDFAPGPVDDPKRVRRSIRALLNTEFETDVHFTSYENLEIPLRLNHGIWLHSEATFMTVDTYDIDCPKTLRTDGRASETWWQEEERKVRRLLEVEPVVCFRTRGGYRLLGARSRPFLIDSDASAEAWTRDYVLRGAFLHGRYGITVDPKCRDFTRVQRAPRALRDGQREPGIIIGEFGHWRYEGMTLEEATRAGETLAAGDVNWRAALTRHHVPVAAPRLDLSAGTAWNLDGPEVTAIVEHIASCFPTSNRHHLCQALGGMLRNRGVSRDVAYHIVFEGARLGGSSDPKTRAKAATDTWRLGPDHAKTAFTRVAEYIGRPAAERLGSLFTIAEKETLLGRVRRRQTQAAAPAAPPAPAAPSQTAVSSPEAGSGTSTNLAELRVELRKIRRRKSKSSDARQIIKALLLQRVLEGEALAQPPECDETTGLTADESLSETMSVLAWNTSASWPVVSALLERSAIDMADNSCSYDAWLDKAKPSFESSRQAREVADLKHREQVHEKNVFNYLKEGW